MTLEKRTGSGTSPYVMCSTTDYDGISCYNSTYGDNATWTMTYGLAGDLNVDLTADGADAILVEVFGGDLEAGPRPTPLTITVVSGAGTASVTKNLVANTTYDFFFSEFAGVDFTDVDRLVFEVVQDEEVNPAIDFCFTRFVTHQASVPAESSSWGRIKALY